MIRRISAATEAGRRRNPLGALPVAEISISTSTPPPRESPSTPNSPFEIEPQFRPRILRAARSHLRLRKHPRFRSHSRLRNPPAPGTTRAFEITAAFEVVFVFEITRIRSSLRLRNHLRNRKYLRLRIPTQTKPPSQSNSLRHRKFRQRSNR